MSKEKVKPLRIPPKRRVSNLYVFCNACSKRVASSKGEKLCGNSGKRLSSCTNGEKQVYKAIVTIPNTGSSMRKARCFESRNIDEVIPLVLAFEEELAKNNYHTAQIKKEEENNSNLVIHRMADFIDFLNNIGVEEHKVKIRSKKHIGDFENYFKKFCSCLKWKGVNYKLLKMHQVSDVIIGYLHEYVLKVLKHQNVTYNKVMSYMRQFYTWHLDNSEDRFKNPFEGVARRRTRFDRSTVSEKEFDNLLINLTKEKGIHTLSTGEKKYLYRQWLAVAFRLALETGMRREEFMTLKFTNVHENEEGEPVYIKQDNFKVNRIQKLEKEEEKEIKFIPVTRGLRDLLYNDLNYEKYKGKNRFLIGNSETVTRKTMIDVVSKAFSHYWKYVDPKNQKFLKHLRKTYITNLFKQYGEKASILTNHASVEIMRKHYIDESLLMNAARDFKVYGGND